MLTKRIIACLDVTHGRVVKGVQFVDLVDAGDPAELAHRHAASGADEVVLLDITATHEERPILLDAVRRAAREIFVPFTVGGGVRSLTDAASLFDAGADKITLNSAAVARPELITEIAERFGSQAVVLAIDARCGASTPGARAPRLPESADVGTTNFADVNSAEVFVAGGRKPTGLIATQWAKEVEDRGAGEIMLTSMDRDGTRIGFDCALTAAVTSTVSIPVIASGGAGNAAHFCDVFRVGCADAALAASIFHFGIHDVRELKQYLCEQGIPVRLPC
ncbi:MAG: imidazole glycerol phosphate synthase subunit HisF [Acidobacteriaceae bacterium]